MNISLTRHYNAFVEKKVKSGRYESRSEVIRAALRIMEVSEEQAMPPHSIPDLEARLLAGLDSPATPVTEGDWSNLRKSVRGQLRKSKAKGR